ncbi:hypothetical protein RFM26_19395 [Mesorhizobium sp. VK23B]|uniref:Uncharacterized protein n=1 Tax=Mesorhizobium dulcispinae TaxID=3072316 RepID=A0ABU4XIZ5_9HYPH|nr:MULTISPECIES: hypothetical protein [unclassified Mesorhizobium]MDX8467863.1 hypothetical protein [Mesorhizobium sp. VK23B]MDX8474201.1 hypothetical protein [Mesorhizobium sp. VK23A]MDX8518828.1 hypothetical protein [Mesorhizobium sp. VK23D]
MKNAISLILATVISFAASQPSQAAAKRDLKPNLDKCVAAVQAWNITLKHDTASFMGVSLERMPALFCQRLGEGIRSGRISYSDINRLQLDQPTEIWLVIKGKSKAAATATPTPRSSRFRTCSNVITGSFEVPASEKCPLGGSYTQAAGVPTVIDGRRKVATKAPTPRTSNFRTCRGIEGTYQVPASQNCPLSGYAHY